MNTTLEKLYPKLHHYSDFEGSCMNADKFIRTALLILKERDPAAIPVLFTYFKDEPTEAWIFENITLFMEHFFGEEYPLLAITHIENLTEHAPDWACTILLDTLRTPPYREIFYKHYTSKKRLALLGVIRRMEQNYLSHKEFLEELVFLLGKIDAQYREVSHA